MTYNANDSTDKRNTGVTLKGWAIAATFSFAFYLTAYYLLAKALA